jgi:nucleoside-diphosphate-sugar epimerase
MILLTGATGFIGRRLQKTLLAHGYRIRALVRPDSANLHQILPSCEIIHGDLNDSEALAHALLNIDAVVYCAGNVRGRTLKDFAEVNIQGVASFVEAISQAGREIPFLLISSLAAGRPELSHYSNSKFLGEQVLKQSGIKPWTVIRPTAVYGVGDKEMLPIFNLARKGFAPILGSAQQKISLIHVDDLCSAIAAWLAQGPSCAAKTYELHDGQPGGYTWRDLVSATGSRHFRKIVVPTTLLHFVARANAALSIITGRAPMLTPGKVNELTQAEWLCDNEPFTRATGWTPGINLEKGLQLTFESS